jgi:hypothetical protein
METAFQKFTRIVNKWIWKSADYDKAYGAQCVDFARQYCADAGYTIGTFSGSAYNGWKTGSPFNKQWNRIEYKTWLYPNPWDVVFFAPTKTNPYGHVAIWDRGCNAFDLCIVEQNAGSGNWDGKWGNAIKRSLVKYNWTRWNCVGWYSIK